MILAIRLDRTSGNAKSVCFHQSYLFFISAAGLRPDFLSDCLITMKYTHSNLFKPLAFVHLYVYGAPLSNSITV
jgi:hypothetical protein